MKYLSIIKYTLLLVSAILVVLAAATFVDDGTESTPLNLMLGWAFVMVILTIFLTAVMPLLGVIQNPRSAIGSLVGLGIIVIVFLVSFALSTDDPITLANKEIVDDSFELKFSDTALYATYIAFGGVIVSILFGELYKVFKK